MKRFLAKAKAFHDSQGSRPSPTSSTTPSAAPSPTQLPLPSSSNSLSPPTPLDLLCYRYHHGVNLGSIFVLEQWLHGSMFPSSSSGDELSAVTASVKEIGLPQTREKWETHWRSALTDLDLAWFVNEARCTSIRLPIGYFTLGPGFCKGTPFEKVGEVYVNAWKEVREVLSRCREWGVGVLLDFHALPGGANGEGHSGTGSGKAELWGNKKNLELSKKCLVWIAQDVRGLEGVIGIQVCNEAVHGAMGMENWYEDVLAAIGEVDNSIPVYISDGWNLGRALEWCNKRKCRGGNPVVVDTHRYYTFSDADRAQTPQQIIGRIPGELAELQGKEGSISDRGEAQIVVGEWSCVLDGKTWARVKDEEKGTLVREFGKAQCKKWEEKGGGSFFWTYKMDWMDGGEWGFVEQTKKGNVTAPVYLTWSPEEIKKKLQIASEKRDGLQNQARQSHEAYWNKTSPGKKFEHYLYSEGWDLGFSDAQEFFGMRTDGRLGEKAEGQGGDKIGCLEIWVKKRLLDSNVKGEFVWEWEQGFRAGVAAFQGYVGI